MFNNQPVDVLTFEVVTILCGTQGLVLLYFVTIAITASIFAGEQINFLVQENPRTAKVAGARALWRFAHQRTHASGALAKRAGGEGGGRR